MILSFKKQFKDKILDGTKIHTIREDKPNRWNAGRLIHLATSVRTKNYNCFGRLICSGCQKIVIEKWKNTGHWYLDFTVCVEGIYLGASEIDELAKNDGFESTESFFHWFKEDFTGRIIHWTDKRY